MSSEKVTELNKIIKNTFINVNEIGNFFEDKQNTVYLKCESENLNKIWDKKDYNYNPHLTIYDGKNIPFAHNLFHSLDDLNIRFSFKTSGLILYNSNAKIPTFFLKGGIENDIIQKIISVDWRSIDPDKLSIKKKLVLIKKCFNYINDENILETRIQIDKKHPVTSFA